VVQNCDSRVFHHAINVGVKRLSPAAIVALKEALCSIYWYKSDLRSFLSSCLGSELFVTRLNWENYKRQVVSDFVDSLTRDQERHLGALTKLCYEVTSITSFSHLEQLDGGEQKARRAKESVDHLRKLVEPHKDKVNEEEQSEERRRKREEKLRTNSAYSAEVDRLFRRNVTGDSAESAL
jgi:hypothetical protein